MDSPRTESLGRLSEQLLIVATDTITDAINKSAIAQAVDTNAIAHAIAAGLRDIRFTNELATEASIIGENVGESVATAVKSAMAASEPKESMDATAMREQTIANIQTIYDLFTGRVAKFLTPIRLITRFGGPGRFSASVVRLPLQGQAVSTPGPAVVLEATQCASDIEALQRLYKASQLLLNVACGRCSQDGPQSCGFGSWDDLQVCNNKGEVDDWDIHHCWVGSAEFGSS